MAMPLSLETAEYEFLVSPLSSVQGLATEPATQRHPRIRSILRVSYVASIT